MKHVFVPILVLLIGGYVIFMMTAKRTSKVVNSAYLEGRHFA